MATSTLVIANNLPDIDVGVFATNTLAMSFRRGWTHGVLAQATLPIALTAAIVLYDRYVKKSPVDKAVKPSQILVLSYLGVLLHVFMDFTNSYGVRLLMPFSNQWFYGDALYIVDPWLYLVLGAGWWLAKKGPRPARIALTLAAVYVIVMLGSNVWARNEVRRGLARAGRPADTTFMVTPVVINPFHREVVIDMGDRYEKGNLWFEPAPHFRPAGFGMEKEINRPEVQALLAQPRAQEYLRWSRFPFVQADRQGGVWLNDYRYANAGPYGWSATKLQ